MTRQYWKVVGGSDAGGVLVRSSWSLQSPLRSQRLATASVVQEIKLQDGRLQYRKVSGFGPEEGWVSIRIGNRDLLVPLEISIARPDNFSRRPLSSLTRGERHAIQLDLLVQYSKFTFQQELHRAWSAANGDEDKQAKMRWAICWDIQAPIFKHHGFAGSPHDVIQSNACFSSEEASLGIEESEVHAGAWLMWLIHPPAQVKHPNGPPSAASATEMLQSSVPGLSWTLPKPKVLAKAPCQHAVEELVYSIRIVGAMTGEVLCTADVAPSDRVCDLKRFISKLEGTPIAEQKLLLNGQLLQCEVDDVAQLYERLCADRAYITDGTAGSLNTQNAERTNSGCLTLSLVRLTAERAALLKDLERGSLSLQNIQDDLREEPECVLAAIKRNPSALQCAPEAMRNDRAFLLLASKVKAGTLQYAPEWAQDDKELVLTAVQLEGHLLRYASEALKADYEVVRAAVDSNGLALEFASASLRASADIVLGAVENAGAALKHADDSLKRDRRIAVTALKQHRDGALRHVADELLMSYTFGAALEDQGLLEDNFFDGLFWATVDVAKSYFDRKHALFFDARPDSDFQLSHLEGAFSLPISMGPINIQQSKAYEAMLTSEDCPIICYSDTGLPASRCVLLQSALRLTPKVRKFRILRLQGGLNAWKRREYPVAGDPRQMLRGMPINTQMIERALRIRQ